MKLKSGTQPHRPRMFHESYHAASARKESEEEKSATICPIDVDPGVFGKKWTLSILRGIKTGKAQRFSQIMESNDGLSPRILSRRLHELEAMGILSRRKDSKLANVVRWKLTVRGRDILPRHPF
jgi:DNA-binding HxlR family transcriptional regulator